MHKLILTIALIFSFTLLNAQCVSNPTNVYSFTYKGQRYEIVKENQNWSDAAACAVMRGGNLAIIEDQAEQDSLFLEAMSNAGITLSNTVAGDGGGASYLWLGANDMATEGRWIWDGINFGNGVHFWQGGVAGMAISGAYTNWGTEPDNFNNQDALGLALTDWPVGSGSLGKAGQWNDVDTLNKLYFIIEYPSLSVPSFGINQNVDYYLASLPGISGFGVSVGKNNLIGQMRIIVRDALGKTIRDISQETDDYLEIALLPIGLYTIQVSIGTTQLVSKKVMVYSR